jgi:hypothetical protein
MYAVEDHEAMMGIPDKKNYKEVLRTAKDQTGKEIEFLKDAKL